MDCNDTESTSATVQERTRERLINLQDQQKHIAYDGSGTFEDSPGPTLLANHGPTSQSSTRLTDSSPLDHKSSTLPTSETADQARNWVTRYLSWQFHSDNTGRAREMSTLKSAVEKEVQGRVQEWSDRERFYMTITDTMLGSYKERLEAAIVLARQENFATRLAIVKDKSLEHLERARRAAKASKMAFDAQSTIVNRLDSDRVGHFACAVPLSTVRDLRECSDQVALCPICHNSFTDTQAFPIGELLADYPVRIKYCGHIVGKACLEQWMDTPKIHEAKFPFRSCPICRTKIEGVPAPAVPTTLRNHVKTDMKAILNRRQLEEMSGCEIEVGECLEAIAACMSEEIAAEELLIDVSKVENRSHPGVEKQTAFLQEELIQLRAERRAWGFRGETVWKKMRDEWMISGIIRKYN